MGVRTNLFLATTNLDRCGSKSDETVKNLDDFNALYQIVFYYKK